MNKRLGLLAGAITLASVALVPALSNPAGAFDSQSPYTNYPGYTYYCFGLKATKTVPDQKAYDYIDESSGARLHSPNYYAGTAAKDVIVTTDGADMVYNVSAGDVVCSLGGDDQIYTDADVNPRTGWNRIKIDAGQGNDYVSEDPDTHNWDSPTAKWANLEVHTGPGDDVVDGTGQGADQTYNDGGADLFYCHSGAKVYVSKANPGTIKPSNSWSPPNPGLCPTVKYPGYNGFVQLRPDAPVTTTTRPALPVTTTTAKPVTTTTKPPTTVTTIRTTSTTSATPVTTAPPAQPVTTTTTR